MTVCDCISDTPLQAAHLSWLAKHPLDIAQDIWRAESAAFACKQDVQLLVRLAILLPFDSLAELDKILLKWAYVLAVDQVATCT